MNHVQTGGMQQARALAWEFWARGWRGQLLGLAGVIGFASLIYGVFSEISDLTFRGTETGRSLHFGFYSVTLFSLGASILAAWGVPRRRYTLPTSSLVIVASTMVCSMVSMFVLYALAATALNLIFDAGWPIWGPGLVAALLIAWLQTLFWSISNTRGSQLASVSSCVMILASWGVLLFGAIKFASLGGPTAVWFHEGVSASHLGMFSLASMGLVGVGTVGFASLRCGSGIEVHRIVDWACRLIPRTARATPFSYPTTAQFWMEWRERGYVMPVGTAVIGAAVLLITPFVARADSSEFFGAISAILFLPAIVIGLFLGARSPDGLFANFNGSRPLTDSQIANAVLKSATVGVFSSALVWAVLLGAVALILALFGRLPSLQDVSHQLELSRAPEVAYLGIRLLGLVALALGAIWGVVALMTSLVLAGKKVGGVVMCTLFGVWIGGGVGSELLLSPEAQDTFQRVFFFSFVALTLLGNAAGFAAAWRLKLISHKTLLMAVGIVAVMFAGAHLAFGLTSDPESYVPVLWGCLLAPSALAVAPLAVWWNRHR